jgi:hypothetical protein
VFLSVFIVGLIVCGCGDDATPPPPPVDSGGPDAFVPEITFDAVADPAEPRGCMSEPPAAGTVRAKHVECDAELLTGAMAMGRTGDLVIENAHARFIIRGGEESATTIGEGPGALLDAGPQGGEDLVKEVFPIVDFSSPRADAIVVTDAGASGTARVRVRFELQALGLLRAVLGASTPTVPARGVIDYELGPDDRALRITTTLTALGQRAGGGSPGIAALMGGAGDVWQPWHDVLRYDRGGGGAIATVASESAISAVVIRLLPGAGSVSHIQSINLMTREERIAALVGETSAFEAIVGVGSSGAEAWNAAHADEAAELLVRASESDRVVLFTEADQPIVRTRVAADGTARIRLPAGAYRVRPGFDRDFFGAPPVAATVPGEVDVAAAPSAILRVEATADGASLPIRILVERGGEERGRWAAIGPTDVRLPPGPARVTLTRGIEYDFHQEEVTLTDGETTTITADLLRAIDTTGWVSGDYHLHTEFSTDSMHAVDEALRLFAAEGLDLVTATDHDYINDYSARAEIAGVADHLLFVSGVEISNPGVGHVQSYPALHDPSRAGAGAVVWFDMTPSEVFDAADAIADPAMGPHVTQINHPRDDSSFLSHVGYDPATGVPTANPVDLGYPPETDLDDFDFDAIEVWNGTRSGGDEQTFVDWLSLYARGRSFAMIGNSDTHQTTRAAGTPRTYARVSSDVQGEFDWADVGAAIMARDLTVSGGIFVTAEVAGARSGGTVPIHVRVQAAPWIDVQRLRIWAGTTETMGMPITGTDPVRLDATIDVPIGDATFVVVRADGDRESGPMLRGQPFGLTNAIDVP